MNKHEILIKTTLAYCTNCNQNELARIMVKDKGVFMERLCPIQGAISTKIAADYKWYMERTTKPLPTNEPIVKTASHKGCPKDCGLCEWHSTAFQLPVFSITNDCNLDCPICFTFNRPDNKYYKSAQEVNQIIDHLYKHKKDIQIINITGGEPTLHPEIFKIIQTIKDRGIQRITMNTNGLKIAASQEFAEKIAACGVHLVLSLDTFDKEKSIKIHGQDITRQKKITLERLEKLNIPTTLLSVCIKDVNEKEVSEIANKYIVKDFVRSITIQNMTFTGKNGSLFKPREHITIDEVETLLSENSMINQADFFVPGAYHPLCYSAAYYLNCDNKLFPLTRFLTKEKLTAFTQNCYLIDSTQDYSTDFKNGINRLWAEGTAEEELLSLKKLVNQIYPTDSKLSDQARIELLEKSTKIIYIHPHMDPDNFDIDRVSHCADVVPDESGRLIPACSYNLLYRQKDNRFWSE